MTGPVPVVGDLGTEAGVHVEYCGEWFVVHPGETFTVGRDADLAIDDNPFLHRRLLEISSFEGLWLLANVGSRLSVTVTDGAGRLQSWLAPGARLPLVFGRTTAVFTAGPTTYEISVYVAEPVFSETHPASIEGTTTIGDDVTFTLSQRQLMVALAEPLLKRDGTGLGEIPTSVKAAARLGWTTTRFNRKLDNVCDKLDRLGVQGLRGGLRSYATNRRIRLVEYAISARLVSRADLSLLDLRAPEE
ncbi:hypothetical protein [Microbacterium trichothecenolyticum]|uniref:FHA domain-containing protein n=1 Tax=Microbacterium trichothecenolyticum TaxID=69370 RepID=A0ABU0TYH3_MICTR|nr:hypothetical protein [Microbacterium trichothecenolyticum]MDQ1124715.1 hypothetical protein [Microbacterium trichothecenolyticum]